MFENALWSGFTTAGVISSASHGLRPLTQSFHVVHNCSAFHTPHWTTVKPCLLLQDDMNGQYHVNIRASALSDGLLRPSRFTASSHSSLLYEHLSHKNFESRNLTCATSLHAVATRWLEAGLAVWTGFRRGCHDVRVADAGRSRSSIEINV